MKIPEDVYGAWSISRIHGDWATLVSQSHRLNDPAFREESLYFARQIMCRVRAEIEKIIERLHDSGYLFAHADSVFNQPELESCEWIAAFRDRGVHVPVALAAWLQEIGSVNLIGTHPEWPGEGYLFESGPGNPIYADPLVCEVTASYANYLYEEWVAADPHTRGPFWIDVSPDHLHKANVSGGQPYKICTTEPALDSLLYNERHCTSFMHYVRLAIQWGGFPGFEYLGASFRNWYNPSPVV